MTIAVAVSGGTDSLYAMSSLRECGEDIFALHALLRDTEHDPVPDLQKCCQELGVPLHVVDLRDAFEKAIIRPFAEAYLRAETPNPCVRCNARIKFGLLLDEARKLGADRIATGHYAALIEHPVYGQVIRKGIDPAKDQSYFLALTLMDRLRQAIFPLGDLTKSEIRQRLEAQGITPPLPHESQEICFIPDDDYRTFLKQSGLRLPAGGPMVTVDGLVVGRHEGLWQYTEGQRRGLGVAWSEPLYVTGKDRSRNTLLLGTAASLKVNGCVAGELNILIPPDRWPNDLYVRTRYRQIPVPAEVRQVGGGPDGNDSTARLLIRFHSPQLPSAPGQLAALFDEAGYLLAGGIILKS